ncbi:MAG: RES family NAD+ phosphorylase [Caulobacteraceae bacterium]
MQILKAGGVLHRNHARGYAPAQFNPGRGESMRFSPFDDASGACVPTLYAATSREAAAFETIFHDIDAKAPFKTVWLGVVENRSVSRLVTRRDLFLAILFTPDLKAWGLTRADLIDTPKSAYPRTASWAGAIHAAHPKLDGMIWTSRQCDPDRCLVLFGDRVSEAGFDIAERLDVGKDAGLLLELRGFGRRAGIFIR